MLPAVRFTAFITQNGLFNTDSRILAAVSGGIDSVLMAHLLAACGCNFDIAHCNFQLRGDEAAADQDFCRQLAIELHAGFHNINFDTLNYAAENKLSVQMAARHLRYEWFEQLRAQYRYNVIALAHHQNDAIETILLNLTRGTGVAGLHGILPKNGFLVRPMLFLHRDEIEQIMQRECLSYREDSSNASTKYARNKIRHQVIPVLKELNPALEETFVRNLEHFREMERLLEHELERQRSSFIDTAGGEVHIPLSVVRGLKPQRLLLFNLLKPYGYNQAQADDIIGVLDKHAGRVFETTAYCLTLDRERLILKKKLHDEQLPVNINAGDTEAFYGRYHFNLLHDDSPLIVKNNPMAASVDAKLLVYPLTIRHWQQGDHFYPLGMAGRQKISDFFTQQKISLYQKKTIPLLVNGNGEVIWIAGYRIDNRYKVSDNTEKVIIFELNKLP